MRNRWTVLVFALVAGIAAGLCSTAGVAGEKTEQEKRIARLVEQLGADEFDVREKATDELEEIGAPAVPALERALAESTDLEVKARARAILQAIREGGEERGAREEEEPRRRIRILPFQPRPRDEDDPGVPAPPQELDRMLRRHLEEMMREFDLPPEFQRLFEGFDERPREEEEPDRGRVRVWTWSNRGERSYHSALGASFQKPSAALRHHLRLSRTDGGLLVEKLEEGGYLAYIGVQAYDLVLERDGHPVNRADDLLPLRREGGELKLVRRGEPMTITVPGEALAPAPEPEKEPAEKKERRSRRF